MRDDRVFRDIVVALCMVFAWRFTFADKEEYQIRKSTEIVPIKFGQSVTFQNGVLGSAKTAS
jgi:hypothetical protein